MKEPPLMENISTDSSMQMEIRNGDIKTDNKENVDNSAEKCSHNGAIHTESTSKICEKIVLLAPKAEEPFKLGIDNPAFESDTHRANGKSANYKEHNEFNLNQSSIDQKLKDDSDYKTTEEIAEAVNLELLNMGTNLANGLNGIPVKNSNSTVINMSNPYDEYFIPVNEHRKYIRGEKLYVTKNKRDLENSKKNCCVWIVGLVTAVVVICLAILIATKFNQDPLSANERRSQDENFLNAGIGYNPSKSSPPNFLEPRATSSVADFMPEYLKRALEGEFTIDNLTFTPGLADHDSKEFKEVATSVEEELMKALFDRSTLTYGSANIHIRVINLTPENVVQYRIGWVFKPGIQNPPDPINVISLKEKLKNYIRRKHGFLYNYRVPVSKIYSKNMIDDCLINNGNCSDTCTFDYEKILDFACSCPENFRLDKTQYNCEPTMNFSTEFFPESTPTPESELKSLATSQREPKSELELTAQPESSSEPGLKFEPEPRLESELLPESEPSSESEPKSKSETTIQSELQSELKSEHELILQSEPKSVSESISQSESKSEAVPKAKPEPTSEPEPVSKSKLGFTSQFESKSEAVFKVEPESKTEPEPTSEPEPTTLVHFSKSEVTLTKSDDSHTRSLPKVTAEYEVTTFENVKQFPESNNNKFTDSRKNETILTNLVSGHNLDEIIINSNLPMHDFSIVPPENLDDSITELVTKPVNEQESSVDLNNNISNSPTNSNLKNHTILPMDLPTNINLDINNVVTTMVNQLRKSDKEEREDGKITTDETVLDDLIENTSTVILNTGDGVEMNLGHAKTDVLNVTNDTNEVEKRKSSLKNLNDLNAVENINDNINLNLTKVIGSDLNAEVYEHNIPILKTSEAKENIPEVLGNENAKAEIMLNTSLPLFTEVDAEIKLDANKDNLVQNNSEILLEDKGNSPTAVNLPQSNSKLPLNNEILVEQQVENNITLHNQLQKISNSNPHLQPLLDHQYLKNVSNNTSVNCDNNTDNELCNLANSQVSLTKRNSSLKGGGPTGNTGLFPKTTHKFETVKRAAKLENTDDNIHQRISTSERESQRSEKQEQNAILVDKKQSLGKGSTNRERKSLSLKRNQKKNETRRSIINYPLISDFLDSLHRTLNK